MDGTTPDREMLMKMPAGYDTSAYANNIVGLLDGQSKAAYSTRFVRKLRHILPRGARGILRNKKGGKVSQ
jgi:hypothetical protein